MNILKAQTRQANLLASLIVEQEFTATLVDTQDQMLRRGERIEFWEAGKALATTILGRLEQDQDIDAVLGEPPLDAARLALHCESQQGLLPEFREPALSRSQLRWAMLGSLEGAFSLAERIHAERLSVSRDLYRFGRPEQICPSELGRALPMPA